MSNIYNCPPKFESTDTNVMRIKLMPMILHLHYLINRRGVKGCGKSEIDLVSI